MKLAYSSLEAFIVHYRALALAASLAPAEREVLAAMKTLCHELTPPALELLDQPAGALNDAQRRRAELLLRRYLVSRGALSG